MRKIPALFVAAALFAQELKFEASSQLVVVNVTVKAKDGNPVTGLTKDDFRVFEDGKPVSLSVFEYQELSKELLAPIPIPKSAALPPAPLSLDDPEPAPKPSYRDKRLLVLFFDFSSLPQMDQIRAKEAAAEFLSKQVTASDLIALYTFSSKLKKVVDFTADRELLLKTVQSFGVASGVEQDPAVLDVIENVADEVGAMVADETEFAIFNTDQKLGALEDLSKELAVIPEKKAVVYFSSGVSKNGMDNQSQLQAAVNAAGVKDRVTLHHGYLPGLSLPEHSFDAVLCKDMLHHLPDPQVLWSEARRLARPGAAIYVMDLIRPDSPLAAREIVERVSANEDPILKEDFYHSLCAAFTVEEVRAQLRAAQLPLQVEAVTDRHMRIKGHIG